MRGRRQRACLLVGALALLAAAVASAALHDGAGTLPRADAASAGAANRSVGGAANRSGGAANRSGRRHDPTPKSGTKALVQPTVAHPLTVLEIGDSLGEDLGDGLDDVLAGHRDVDLVTKAVGDTGLANVAYYNWPAVFSQELAAYHPGLVVVLIGGNDAQGFDVDGRPAFFGTAFWRQQYRQRVATMMSEARKAGAQVLWVGMPIMASAAFSADMELVNGIYASEAARFKNVRYYSSWKLFSDSAGQYAAELPGPGGQLVEVRDPDGVHIAPPGGDDRIAAAVVKAVDQDWSIKL